MVVSPETMLKSRIIVWRELIFSLILCNKTLSFSFMDTVFCCFKISVKVIQQRYHQRPY